MAPTIVTKDQGWNHKTQISMKLVNVSCMISQHCECLAACILFLHLRELEIAGHKVQKQIKGCSQNFWSLLHLPCRQYLETLSPLLGSDLTVAFIDWALNWHYLHFWTLENKAQMILGSSDRLVKVSRVLIQKTGGTFDPCYSTSGSTSSKTAINYFKALQGPDAEDFLPQQKLIRDPFSFMWTADLLQKVTWKSKLDSYLK